MLIHILLLCFAEQRDVWDNLRKGKVDGGEAARGWKGWCAAEVISWSDGRTKRRVNGVFFAWVGRFGSVGPGIGIVGFSGRGSQIATLNKINP
jgi:hypothetical protein